jgi:hypothetical protein
MLLEFYWNPHSASCSGDERIKIETQPKPAGKEVIINSAISVENLDHLGIVAGLIDEIGIVEILNQRLGINSPDTF